MDVYPEKNKRFHEMLRKSSLLYKIGICRWGCRDETAILIESEDVETDEICDAVYTIEKRRQEALLLHLGRLIVGTA